MHLAAIQIFYLRAIVSNQYKPYPGRHWNLTSLREYLILYFNCTVGVIIVAYSEEKFTRDTKRQEDDISFSQKCWQKIVSSLCKTRNVCITSLGVILRRRCGTSILWSLQKAKKIKYLFRPKVLTKNRFFSFLKHETFASPVWEPYFEEGVEPASYEVL